MVTVPCVFEKSVFFLLILSWMRLYWPQGGLWGWIICLGVRHTESYQIVGCTLLKWMLDLALGRRSRRLLRLVYMQNCPRIIISGQVWRAVVMLTESQGELTHLIHTSWSIAGEWSIDGEVPSLHGKQVGKQWKQWQILFSWAPKSLQMVTAAMKIKDSCSLEEKLWQT